MRDTNSQCAPSRERSRIEWPCAFQYAGTYQVSPSALRGRQNSQPHSGAPLIETGRSSLHFSPSSLVAYRVV